MLPKNLKPEKCARLLVKNGWEFVNREGTHETYSKIVNGKLKFLQVIFNSKTIYPTNAKRMIEKSDIPLSVWLKKCK